MADGARDSLSFGENRQASLFKFTGHVNLKDTVGEKKDFWSECIGLADSQTGSIARCVWRSLDDQEVYITLKGEKFAQGSKVTGEIVGGTGVAEGISGTLQFEWSSMSFQTHLAPIVTYTMTMFAGTGHTAFSTLPVIAEVAKREGIRPSRPLAIATVASQIAIIASPISAAVVFFSSELEKVGVDYVQLLMIAIPSSFIAVMLAAIPTNFMGKELKDDPIYLDRLAKGQVKIVSEEESKREIPAAAKLSVLIFAIAIVCVVFYAVAISPLVGLIKEPILERDHAIISFMLGAATMITLFCKLDAKNILNAATFKSGMSACICVLGVAWLGTTFVAAHMDEINVLAGNILESKPWLLAVVLFFLLQCSFIPRLLPPKHLCPLRLLSVSVLLRR